MNTQTESHTRLSGRWLLIARLAWGIMFATLTVMYALGFLAVHEALSTVCEEELCTFRQQIRHTDAGEQVERWSGPPIGYADRLRPDQVEALERFGLTLDQYGWLGALQIGLPVLVYLLIAAGLFWRRSEDWMVLFASVMVATIPYANGPLPFMLLVHQPAREWVFDAVGVVALSCFLIFPLIFPTGRFVPRWTRWMAVFEFIGAVVVTLFHNSIMESPGAGKFVRDYVVISLATGVYGQLYRYFRVATAVERQQLKWVIVGLAGFVSIALVVLLPLDAFLTSRAAGMDPARALLLSLIPDTFFQVILLFIPVSIAISVLRYRLWDIDFIISRTLVYGTLTASVVGLYVLIVGGLSTLLQTQNNLPNIIIAILLIAFLFQPLRRRLQEIVNRFVPVPKVVIRESISPPVPLMEKQQTVVITETAPSTILHGRWLVLARLAWAAVFITLAAIYAFGFLAVHETLSTICEAEPCTLTEQIRRTDSGAQIVRSAGPPVGHADRLRPDQVEALETLGFTLDQYGWLGALQLGLPALVLLLIAAGLFWWKSDDWMALFASVMVATFPMHNTPLAFNLTLHQPTWEWADNLVSIVALSCLLIFPLLFPTGQFVPRWTRWMAFYDVTSAVIASFLGSAILEVFGDVLGPVFIGVLVLLPFGIGVYAQMYRYFRVARPAERQQFKWVVVGLVGAVVIQFAVLIPLNALLTSPAFSADPVRALVVSAIPDTLWQVNLLLIPVCITISVLRYRLWDIDILINRALVYGILTAGVVGLYALTVGWLSMMLDTHNYLLANVFAIVMIAFLFQPLRQLLQGIADRFVPVPQSAPPVEQHEYQRIAPLKLGATDTSTTLRGRWLLIARLAWAAGFIALTAMYTCGFLAVRDAFSTICEGEPCTLRQQIRHTAAGDQVKSWLGPPIGYADRLRSDQVRALDTLGLTLDRYGWLAALQMGLPVLLYLLIAAGLFWWKSDDRMVLFVSTMVMTFPFTDMPLPFTLMVRQPAWEWIRAPAELVALNSYLIFMLIFPNGQFVPRWTRWKVPLDIAFGVINTFFPNSIAKNPGAEDAFFVYLLMTFCIGVYAQVYRYRRVASPTERQQVKWVVVGLAGFIIIAAGMLLPLNRLLISQAGSMDPARALVLSAIPDTLFRAISLFIPISIAISVLRYRLWDIDVIISRTLVYGALTACIVALYILLVGALSLLSQTTGNLLISLLATGLIAFLFQPLRERLQRGVNRLVYGERDDPYIALSRLGRRLEASLAPEAVLPTVVTTVREVLKLPYVAIYLQQDLHGFKIVAESASPSLRIENGRIRVPGMNREGLCIPLIHQGETLGYIVLGPRAPNEAFGPTDLHLLEDLAPQVGVAVHAVRLTADLQRSRERLVLAREEERRRLRRDLHDDLGPTLASLGLAASTVADLIPNNPAAATKLVKELESQIRGTVGNIRKLVYDLRPPTLDELGLLAAVRERAARYSNAPDGFHVAVDALAELPTLPAAVEVAAYRIVQEALENVSKHSQARQCTIRFANHNGLEIEVTDDGIGLPPNITPGVGLRSMRERAEELGGSCTIENSKNGGTRVLACLPIGEYYGTFAHPDRG